MVWGCISYTGILSLLEIPTTINWKEYVRTFDRGLLPVVGSALGEEWIVQQENASVHNSYFTLN